MRKRNIYAILIFVDDDNILIFNMNSSTSQFIYVVFSNKKRKILFVEKTQLRIQHPITTTIIFVSILYSHLKEGMGYTSTSLNTVL